jgi:hypothetical protein
MLMMMTFSLVRYRQNRHVSEEEKKINSLKESHELDSSEAKEQLSLSSTSLPDVGIHEPEFHVKG